MYVWCLKRYYCSKLYLPEDESLVIGFSVLGAAVVLGVGGTFLGVSTFALLRVVDEDVVLRAEKATKK